MYAITTGQDDPKKMQFCFQLVPHESNDFSIRTNLTNSIVSYVLHLRDIQSRQTRLDECFA